MEMTVIELKDLLDRVIDTSDEIVNRREHEQTLC